MSRSTGALARSPVPRLVASSVPAPAGCDPLALLQGVPGGHRFYLEQPAAGIAIAGVGATVTVAGRGPGRFHDLAAGLRDLTDGRPLPPDVVAVGGFSFDDAHADAGPWRGFPVAEWVVPRVMLVRRGGRTRLVATTLDPADSRGLCDGLERARAALENPLVTRPPSVTFHALGAHAAPWRRAVETTLDDIAAGRLAKLVLARACTVRSAAPLDPLRVLTRLRRANPGCTIFGVAHGESMFVGASPERLARVAGRRLDTAAVAGTAPLCVTGRELASNPKERGEHALVVEDIVQGLAPLCDDVAAAPAPRVLATETLQHLRTPIRARLRPGHGLLETVAALHPTASICGTPRAVARATLHAREPVARGWYAGGVGWLDARGGEIVVAIRTGLLRGAEALLHAGAGIVAGSAWESELEETRLKMRPLLAALLEL
jgi:salicylate biosynthesis isochorismate synthase